MKLSPFFLSLSILLVLALFAHSPCVFADYPHARATEGLTALDRYVAKEDDNFAWDLAQTDETEEGIQCYTLSMTSQKWRDSSEVNRTVWDHWVTVCIPETVTHKTALMFIDGGSNRPRQEPREASRVIKDLARQSNCITATVYMIPNQPLTFSDQMGMGRGEDALIAYTWNKFYRTGDEEWPLRLPMTKAVVRAMDAVQLFAASEKGGGHKVADFIVAGGSKRGWTTWTTTIVDARVRALVPFVIDLLNVTHSFRHHFESLGRWSAAVGDYQALDILKWLGTPENDALMDIVDPFSYVDRLTMPKLIVNAGNDQFFLPDSSQFYWDTLEGPKWIRYMPNVGHGLNRREAYNSLASFFIANIQEQPIPVYSFSFEGENGIRIQLLPAANGEVLQPVNVALWEAYNPKSRDFRGQVIAYEPRTLEAAEEGVYEAFIDVPESGWKACFVELTFEGPQEDIPYKFTSGVRILPETGVKEYVPSSAPPKGFLSQ
ncbi:MAG: hypothetical protein GX130_00255 [Candidatus Hydrogenedens sp.]|jgi:PhoPQ-activated pathogenicity-related protein|nr:hypothetical protein [Candidatus Hydrogenedens sp.]